MHEFANCADDSRVMLGFLCDNNVVHFVTYIGEESPVRRRLFPRLHASEIEEIIAPIRKKFAKCISVETRAREDLERLLQQKQQKTVIGSTKPIPLAASKVQVFSGSADKSSPKTVIPVETSLHSQKPSPSPSTKEALPFSAFKVCLSTQ